MKNKIYDIVSVVCPFFGFSVCLIANNWLAAIWAFTAFMYGVKMLLTKNMDTDA